MKKHFSDKGKARILYVFLAFLLLSLIATTVKAKEWDVSVPVTYTKESSDTYSLSVHVRGAGSLIIESDKLRNEERNYQLAVDKTKMVRFQLDQSSAIKKVTLNGQDVKHQVKNDQLIIEGKAIDQSLDVEFQDKISVPSTGDSTMKTSFIVLLFLSLGVMYVWRKKYPSYKEKQVGKEQKNEEE